MKLSKAFAVSILFVTVIMAVSTMDASATTVTTGDLGSNVVWGGDGGYYEVSLALSAPSNLLPAMMEVKYGLWNGSADTVAVSINGFSVGSMVADGGYIVPGPKYADFVVTGYLIDGLNVASFQGDYSNDYVIGRVDISYNNPVPIPAALWLFGPGLAGLALVKRRFKG
jgi:hypothetical protein